MNRNYSAAPLDEAADEASRQERGEREERDPFLTAMGERVRLLRARRGMTRKTLATETGNLVVELRLGLKPDHLSRISPRLMPPRADYGRIYDGLNSDGSLIGKNS